MRRVGIRELDLKALKRDCDSRRRSVPAIHTRSTVWPLVAGLVITVVGSLVVAVLASDLQVRAYVDKTTVRVGEQLTLSLELSGTGVEGVPAPSPPVLDHARYLGNGSSRSVQIINGSMSTTRTLNFYYQTTEVGTLKVGPISVPCGDRPCQTEPLTVQVVKGSAGLQTPGKASSSLSGDDIFIRAEVSKQKAFQNEAVLLTYKLYTRVEISRYEVSDLPEKTGFWVENLLKEQQHNPTSTEIIDGRRYAVATLQKMLIFPTSPGTKTLAPLAVDVEVRVRTSRRSLFDDWFSDPFGRTARYTVRAQPVSVEVLPLPESGKPADFSGAVGQFQVSSSLDKEQAATNEVTTLKVAISGSGNIRTLPNPEIKFSPSLEVYDPKIKEQVTFDGSTPVEKRDYEYVIVPRVPGRATIGEVRLSYFDPETMQYRTASSGDIVIDVAGKENPVVHSDDSGLAKQDIRLMAQEIRFIKLNPGVLRDINVAFYQGAGFWMIILFPGVLLVGAVFYRRHSDRLAGDIAYARGRRALRAARERFAKARALLGSNTQQEFHAELWRALTGFVADKLNLPEAGLVTEEVHRLLKERNASDRVLKSLNECLQECDRNRFSPLEASRESMAVLLSKAEDTVQELAGEL